MAWFGRNKAPELQRVDEARSAIERNGSPRPVIMHTLDKVEAAIEVALADRDQVRTSLEQFDSARIDTELKSALRAKASPHEADSPNIMSLRRRHEALHELRNRADQIEDGIEKALIDLETLVAQAAMTRVADDGVYDDLRHWLDLLDDDARALTGAHDAIDDASRQLEED